MIWSWKQLPSVNLTRIEVIRKKKGTKNSVWKALFGSYGRRPWNSGRGMGEAATLHTGQLIGLFQFNSSSKQS